MLYYLFHDFKLGKGLFFLPFLSFSFFFFWTSYLKERGVSGRHFQVDGNKLSVSLKYFNVPQAELEWPQSRGLR